MTVSFQHRQLPRGEAEAEVKRARWPLVVLALSGLATLAWIGMWAWLVFELVMWLWN